jgi:hypothetical protein
VAGRVCGLATPKVRHRKSEIHSRVGKFAQNLHVGDMAAEAEKKSLKPRFKHARFLVFRRPTRKALYVIQRAFVLQQYIHRSFRCGYAAIHDLQFQSGSPVL